MKKIPPVERLVLENEKHSVRVPTAEIEVVEGETSRVRITHGNHVYVAAVRFNDLLARLGPQFVRVSRSMAVKLEHQ